MLADTDAGSIVTAAQSGARWGYRLLWLQILLIPILYLVQELTVRLGLSTGKGQGGLIHEYFGWGWAWFSAIVLFVSAVGALVTEFAGISRSMIGTLRNWLFIEVTSGWAIQAAITRLISKRPTAIPMSSTLR